LALKYRIEEGTMHGKAIKAWVKKERGNC